MKKIVLSTMGAFFLTALVMSCDQPKETEVAPTTAKTEEELLSAIDQMEKEEGVKFFKQDVVLKDKSTGTKIILRLASLDKETLEEHLTNIDFQVKPLFDDVSPNRLVNEPELEQKSSPNQRSSMIVEVLEKQLPKGATGYRLSVKEKTINVLGAKNAKVNLEQKQYEVISDPWPEEFIIKVNSGQNVSYALDKKMNWTSSWTSFYQSGGWYPLQGPTTVSHWLDGPQSHGLSPWKARAKVVYYSMSPMQDVRGFDADFFDRK